MSRRGKIALTLFAVILAFLFLPPLLRRSGDGYNFASYRDKTKQAPPPFLATGQRLPSDFPLTETGGKPVKLGELWKDRPLVIETGSRTCPIYVKGAQSLEGLYARYKDKANFILLYVREAHPGLAFGPHRSVEEKMDRAKVISAHLQRPVYIEGLEGVLHQQLGGGPNSAYVVGIDGVVVHSSFWSVGPDVEAALNNLLQHGGTGGSYLLPPANTCHTPRHLGVGDMLPIFLRMVWTSGPDAVLDFFLNGSSPSTAANNACR